MNSPQPPPVFSGVAVSINLLKWIEETTLSLDVKESVNKLIEERCDYGLRKYGQCLMSGDGRDDVVDAMQEAGDLLQYAYKAKLNGRLEELKQSLQPTLEVLMLLLKT